MSRETINARALQTHSDTPGLADNDVISCPFCGESGFDLYGLARHLDYFGCDMYDVCRYSSATLTNTEAKAELLRLAGIEGA